MIDFDSKNNILSITKVKELPFEKMYQKNVAYESYMDYINNGLLKDVENILIPAWNAAIAGPSGPTLIWYKSGRVVYDNTSTYRGDEYYSVFVKLGGTKIPSEGTKEFCIFKVPYMDEDGVIHKNGKYYSLYNELVQSDDITYSPKKVMKIVSEQGAFKIEKTKTDMLLKYRSSDKYSMFDLLFALASEEGLDQEKMFHMLRDSSMVNHYKSESEEKVAMMYARPKFETSNYGNILAALKDNKRNIKKVRSKLNEALSIKRCLGKELAKPITLSSGATYEIETVITPGILRAMECDRINEVFVRRVPQMQGHYLAEDVDLPILRKGTEIVTCLEEYFPEEKSCYLNRNVYESESDRQIVLFKGTPVTKGLLEMLAYNGHEGVKLSMSPSNSAASIYVSFEMDIISNKHVKSANGDWVYINPDGTESPAKETLTAYDVLALMSLMCSLDAGYDIDCISDLDLGLRKNVASAGEAFHKAFERVTPEFFKLMKRTLLTLHDTASDRYDDPDFMEAKLFKFSDLWWKLMRSEDNIIRPMEMLNPVEYLSSLSKVFSHVKDQNAVSDSMHGLTMGHYGRICPYESPQSRRLGTTNNFAIGCRRGLDGKMRTMYRRVIHDGGKSYVTDDIIWLTVEEEETKRIADITSIETDKDGRILTKGRVLARTPITSGLEKVVSSYVDIKYIDLVNVNPNQSLGLTTTTIPFVGADDSARVSFGQGMCKQAKGQVDGKAPIVITSAYRDIPRLTKFYAIFAEEDGEVAEAKDGYLVVQYYTKSEVTTYDFKPTEFADGSVVVRKLEVSDGTIFHKGDVLMSSNFVKDGLLALGQNALVGFMTTGYNYEDGDQISVDFSHRITSYGTVREKEPIVAKYDITTIKPYPKYVYHKAGDKIYARSSRKGSRSISSNVTSRRVKGFVIDVSKDVDSMSKRDNATVARSVSFDYGHKGDKIANRHGNKGVVPRIEENNKMGRLSNGMILDVMYNFCGVSSRMNLGQILEANAGLACYVLGIKLYSPSFNGATTKEVKDLLAYAWAMANEDNAEAVTKRFPQYPKSMHQYCLNRIDLIRCWKGTFTPRGTAKIFNPRTGKYTENEVLIGINYIYKLEHEVSKKVHARGGLCTEPYVKKSDAPTESSSKLGGQRQGSMELGAYSAYGAAAFIDEMMNARGDNSVARNNMTVRHMHKGDKYIIEEGYAMRRSTEEFMADMAGLGCWVEFDEHELPNLDKNYINGKYAYPVGVLTRAADSEEGDKSKVDSQTFNRLLGDIR